MTRPDPSQIEQLTAHAEKWLRRCNNKPWDGIPVSRAALCKVLAISADVTRDPRGWITWRGPAGDFTAEPVSEETPETPC